MKTIVPELVASLLRDMKPHGFSKPARYILKRSQAADHSELMFFGSRKNAVPGVELVSINVCFLFPQIKAFLDPHGAEKNPVTFGVPIHFLKPGANYHEWPFAPDSFTAMRDDILEWIEQYVLPFYAAFPTLESVVEHILSPTPGDWFAMPPTLRASILAAGLSILNRRMEAIAFLEQQIEEREQQFAANPMLLHKYCSPLQRLRTQLAEHHG